MFLTQNTSIANSSGFMIALLVSLLAVILLAPKNIITLFIVLGQAHFIISYVYQWRAGKIGFRFIFAYLLALGFIGILIKFAPQKDSLFLVMAGIIFSIHFFIDELYLAHSKFTLPKSLMGLGFVLLYGTLLFKEGYGVDYGVFLPILAMLMIIPFAISAIRSRKINASEMLIVTSSAVLVLISIMEVRISIEAMLGFIVLFHYARWYVFYVFRFTEMSNKLLNQYIFIVLFINISVVGAYFIYTFAPFYSPFYFVFDQTYFFAWTILHILFSVNFERLSALQKYEA